MTGVHAADVAYAVGVVTGLLVGWFLTWSHYRDKLRGRHRRQVQVGGDGAVQAQAGGDLYIDDTLVDQAHPPYGR